MKFVNEFLLIYSTCYTIHGMLASLRNTSTDIVCIYFSTLLGMQFSQAVCICMSQVAVMKRVQVIYNENVSKTI